MNVEASNGLVRILKAEGVEWVSTFPDTVINNACGEEGVPNLMVRTERFAIAVADGYSRVSNGRKIGVCSVMGGINAAGIQMAYGAMAQAYEDSTPILCVTDGIAPQINGRNRYDITESFSKITKWTAYINQASRVPEFMKRAFTYLRTGNKGPVLIQLPQNLGRYEESEHPYIPVKGWKYQGDPKDVKIAARALLASEKPMIYAGQGIFYADACSELIRFAELIEAPVVTTLKGKSAFPEDHPLSLGVRGIQVENFLINSDLIFAIGCSLSPGRFSHKIPNASRKTIVQCTIDDRDINRDYSVDHAIVGDAKLVIEQLISEIEKQGKHITAKKDLIERIENLKKEHYEEYLPHLTSQEIPINPYRVHSEIMNTIDLENSLVTHESGGVRDQLSTIFESHVPHGFVGWGNVSTLGFSLGVAMGAKLAFSKRQVISVIGDAAVGYQLGNYEALHRNHIGITIIHINNSGFSGYGPGFWGSGHHPYTAAVTPSSTINMAKSVEELGLFTERIEDPDEISPAIKRALTKNQSGVPSYLEVICSQFPISAKWL